MSIPERVNVPVKSAWLSKINWTQAAAVSFAGIALFGIDVPAQTQADILAGIIGAQSAATWVMRTFFTKAITPSAAG